MVGPPASIPAALPAFTTTLWPDNNARRSTPADDLVISTEIAAIPITTVSPDNAPITATTTGVVHKPIPTQHRPIQAHATDAVRTGLVRRTTVSDAAVPISEPTPYPV